MIIPEHLKATKQSHVTALQVATVRNALCQSVVSWSEVYLVPECRGGKCYYSKAHPVMLGEGFSFYFSFWFMEHGSSSGGSGPYSSMSEEQCSFVVTPHLSSLEAKEKEDDCKLSAAEGQSVCQSPDTACFRVCALVPEEAILCARVLIQCILEVVLWSLKKQFWNRSERDLDTAGSDPGPWLDGIREAGPATQPRRWKGQESPHPRREGEDSAGGRLQQLRGELRAGLPQAEHRLALRHLYAKSLPAFMQRLDILVTSFSARSRYAYFLLHRDDYLSESMGKEERASHLPVDKLVQRSVNAPLVSVGVRGILFSRYNNRFKSQIHIGSVAAHRKKKVEEHQPFILAAWN
ncbi:hypothetical protein Anapl_05577 [Anas platyrhynchos]|uniref:Uncharacterized protein n=1 Tax=Anas platyrhynchos TaxID=8839 RepID=R0LN35_ANAPL|nr:hypothetical protein Anapl_05577 [Anas platyrhynchos]